MIFETNPFHFSRFHSNSSSFLNNSCQTTYDRSIVECFEKIVTCYMINIWKEKENFELIKNLLLRMKKKGISTKLTHI